VCMAVFDDAPGRFPRLKQEGHKACPVSLSSRGLAQSIASDKAVCEDRKGYSSKSV